ncbi:hypothetical protein HDU98_003181 [Podochytrium sp. JEL0797]|nr:hypothetical protein HDU98_003181 [Podochytrium sp. JEL0797]
MELCVTLRSTPANSSAGFTTEISNLLLLHLPLHCPQTRLSYRQINLFRCHCGKATLAEEALYCSLACKKADTPAVPGNAIAACDKFSPATSPAEKPPYAPHLVFIDQRHGTFNFISSPELLPLLPSAATAVPKRPRMNSIETPPPSPPLIPTFGGKSLMVEPEHLFTQLAFFRKKRV